MSVNKYKFLDGVNEWGEKQHIHTLNGKYLNGTSSVLSILNKPLTWWAAGLAVKELGWTNPKETERDERIIAASTKLSEIKGLGDDAYLALLDKAYRAHASTLGKSATKGTGLHETLERFCKGEKLTDKELELINPFVQWSKANVKRFIASEGYCYSEEHWLGGIVDLLFEDNEGRIAIMDFKSAKAAYFSHFLQRSLYAIEISENGIVDNNGNEVYKLEKPISYYAVFPFGMENPTPQIFLDTEEAKIAALAALQLYRINKKYEKQ